MTIWTSYLDWVWIIIYMADCDLLPSVWSDIFLLIWTNLARYIVFYLLNSKRALNVYLVYTYQPKKRIRNSNPIDTVKVLWIFEEEWAIRAFPVFQASVNIGILFLEFYKGFNFVSIISRNCFIGRWVSYSRLYPLLKFPFPISLSNFPSQLL